MTSPSAQDWFGHMIGLWGTIADFRNELTVDRIEQNPRTIMLAIEAIEARAKDLVEAMKSIMEQFQDGKDVI